MREINDKGVVGLPLRFMNRQRTSASLTPASRLILLPAWLADKFKVIIASRSGSQFITSCQ